MFESSIHKLYLDYSLLFPKLFNPLFFLQRANKQLSILLGYDIAIQALNYHLAFIGCMNHTVLAFIQTDVSWHCQPHPVVARYGGCPSCLNHSSQTRLAKYRFPSTSPSRHSQCLSSRRLGRVCRLPLSPFRYRKSKHPTPMTIQLHPQCLLGIQGILRNWAFLIFKQV